MRSLLFLTSLFAIGALASHLGAVSEDWRDYTWSYEPDKSADFYGEHGLETSLTAMPITPVKFQESYTLKLECLGCPFRVREYGQLVEQLQEPP